MTPGRQSTSDACGVFYGLLVQRPSSWCQRDRQESDKSPCSDSSRMFSAISCWLWLRCPHNCKPKQQKAPTMGLLIQLGPRTIEKKLDH